MYIGGYGGCEICGAVGAESFVCELNVGNNSGECRIRGGIGINADSTPLDYANAVIKANELSESTAEERDGMVCFTYTAKSGLKTYSYLATVHKSEDAFWLIQFSSSDKKFEEKEPTFLSYAKSIVLS